LKYIANRLRIFEIREQTVVLDSDLAAVYGVNDRCFQSSYQEKPRSVSGRFLIHPEEG